MTPYQRRRLDAAAAALSGCLGCLIEDQLAADSHLQSLSPERVAATRRLVDDLAQMRGRDPTEWETEDELQQQREQAQARVDDLTALRQLSTTRSRARGSATCPGCEARRRSREIISRLAERLTQNQAGSREDDDMPECTVFQTQESDAVIEETRHSHDDHDEPEWPAT